MVSIQTNNSVIENIFEKQFHKDVNKFVSYVANLIEKDKGSKQNSSFDIVSSFDSITTENDDVFKKLSK
ncbi:MAG: hypothetical protein JKY28_01405 [Sulfurimonas sp.]|nr:hypothetical protein [Sulfurimonas sp.]